MNTGLRWLAVTPPQGSPDPSLVDLWLELGMGDFPGAIWLRDPWQPGHDPTRANHRLGPLVRRAQQLGVPLVLGIDTSQWTWGVEVMRARGLAGLHLRGDPRRAQLHGLTPALPAAAILGRSIHSLIGDDAAFAYSCFAPIATPRTAKVPTGGGPYASHHGIQPGLGLVALAQAAAMPGAWILAMGGIDGDLASAALAAGAAGLAGIRSFFGEPRQVAEDVAGLCAALHQALSHGPPPQRSPGS